MNAETVTLIASILGPLAAATIGAFVLLIRKVNKAHEKVEQQATINQIVSSRFEKGDARFEALQGRVERSENRLSTQEEKTNGLQRGIDEVKTLASQILQLILQDNHRRD